MTPALMLNKTFYYVYIRVFFTLSLAQMTPALMLNKTFYYVYIHHCNLSVTQHDGI